MFGETFTNRSCEPTASVSSRHCVTGKPDGANLQLTTWTWTHTTTSVLWVFPRDLLIIQKLVVQWNCISAGYRKHCLCGNISCGLEWVLKRWRFPMIWVLQFSCRHYGGLRAISLKINGSLLLPTLKHNGTAAACCVINAAGCKCHIYLKYNLTD